MKDLFFRQLEVPPADVTLALDTSTDQSMIGSLVSSLGNYLDEAKPDAVVFLGDTNTVTASIAVASKNIPIVHIEGCMRSYDWRMPEEKYRTAIDHLADVIYAYLDEYKAQGMLEGLDPANIIVSGNPIVDVLEHYFLSGRVRLAPRERNDLFSSWGYSDGELWSMTCHRRENVDNPKALLKILKLASKCPGTVVFPAGYRTQARIREFGLSVPANIRIIDPIGYVELMELMVASTAILTDSGTVVEEAAVLGVPSVQMRTSTERPQVYDTGGSVKFDPHSEQTDDELVAVIGSADSRRGQNWSHTLGDGKASQRIAEDLISRIHSNQWAGHLPNPKTRPISRNYGYGLNDQGRP
jgi:UDP-N-acetylglucosamine 2-epimerase (non-hydrolysing)